MYIYIGTNPMKLPMDITCIFLRGDDKLMRTLTWDSQPHNLAKTTATKDVVTRIYRANLFVMLSCPKYENLAARSPATLQELYGKQIPTKNNRSLSEGYKTCGWIPEEWFSWACFLLLGTT